jgi:SAM-dependent methyltransferase
MSTARAIDYSAYSEERKNHWDEVARRDKRWWNAGAYYHDRLAQRYGFMIPPGQRVLEIGCGQGDLLAALKPSFGVGIEFSSEMAARARQRHPELHFVQCDAHDLALDTAFDAIVASDLVNDLWDVLGVLEQIGPVATPSTLLVLNTYSRVWDPLLSLAQRLGLATPVLRQNWLTVEDIDNFLHLADFEMIRRSEEILWPLRTPLVHSLANRYLVRLWPFREFALTNIVVARFCPRRARALEKSETKPLVSVIVPARNEAENIATILDTVPEMGGGTEIIFVEGHSEDNTYETIGQLIPAYPERRCNLYRQKGMGKGDAVRLGFAESKGDILMILDADLTVPATELPRVYERLDSRKGQFVNGVRLVYPMDEQAMRFMNLLGNKFFSLAFSWLLGQPVKDTLCGTKALWKADYDRIAANRGYFGDFDPFGDFDLLFGAARLNLKTVELAIRYRARTYGETNISRWRHGWLLLRMVLFAARRIRFV